MIVCIIICIAIANRIPHEGKFKAKKKKTVFISNFSSFTLKRCFFIFFIYEARSFSAGKSKLCVI